MKPMPTGDMARLVPFTNERGEVEVLSIADLVAELLRLRRGKKRGHIR